MNRYKLSSKDIDYCDFYCKAIPYGTTSNFIDKRTPEEHHRQELMGKLGELIAYIHLGKKQKFFDNADEQIDKFQTIGALGDYGVDFPDFNADVKTSLVPKDYKFQNNYFFVTPKEWSNEKCFIKVCFYWSDFENMYTHIDSQTKFLWGWVEGFSYGNQFESTINKYGKTVKAIPFNLLSSASCLIYGN